MFGRGTSFYRWNTILADLGFKFKEEIIWNKVYKSSPMTPVSRQHETISIHSKRKDASIRSVKIPYVEARRFNIESIERDIKRLKSALGNPTSLQHLQQYLSEGIVTYESVENVGFGTTIGGSFKKCDRNVSTAQGIALGLKEASIMNINREHYKAIHPTQKPIRLLERLLALVSKQGDTVLDPFAGSFSTAIACHNMNLKFIGFEIDKEYYEAGLKKIKELCLT